MANGNGSAPVCPVSRSQTVPGMPGVQYPAVPRAFDLPSAIAAINQIVMMLPALTGHPVVNNNVHSPSIPPPDGSGSGGSGASLQWGLVKRNVQMAKVYNPDDQNVWIEIPRLGSMNFNNRVSGNTFDWEL